MDCIINVWGYQHWNTTNTALDLYLLFQNGHKSTQRRCNVCSNLTKCTATIDFRLTSVFFINLELLSHPTLVLLFILWRGKCWLKVGRELLVNNAVMLTYTQDHAPGILLWQCSCHRNEKQNSDSFFNYDVNLTSVITMELKFFFSLRCWFLCMTSLSVTPSMLKTSVKFWGISFKFWLRPCFPFFATITRKSKKVAFFLFSC